MRRNFKPLTPEMVQKLRRSVDDVQNQKVRALKCPYCRNKAVFVFEDTRGHVQAKCSVCKKETVYDVMSMRRISFRHIFG